MTDDFQDMGKGYFWIMAWESRKAQIVPFYDFVMHGFVAYAKPILRFDHPGRKLAESLFSRRLCGEKRREA